MSALAADHHTFRLREQMRRYRNEGCRLAAMILLAEPERIGDEPIATFLFRIEYLRPETIRGWLRRLRIDPLRPAGELQKYERDLLAGILVQYTKERQP